MSITSVISLDPGLDTGLIRDDSSARTASRNASLVRRINQLYHDLTQDVFDVDHQYRHRVERNFWRHVIDRCLTLPEHRESGPAARTVVDLACGTGFEASLLAKSMRAQDRLIAVDISAPALASTARKCAPAAPALMVGDGSALPLAGETADLFAINAALHHMPDPAAVLAEVDRVLKPGGWFALGFEPNSRHFGSSLSTVARGVDRLAWYASPRQNLRRLRGRLGPARALYSADANDIRVAAVINRALQDDALVDEPLSVREILDLVDPHARGADAHAGFDAPALIRSCFPAYRTVRLFSSDFLGESMRRFRMLRATADAALRLCRPAQGSLFSCLLRKPVGGEN